MTRAGRSFSGCWPRWILVSTALCHAFCLMGNHSTTEDTMHYVDGFIVAVPEANKTELSRARRTAAVIFKDHGALSVVECWGDEVPAEESSPLIFNGCSAQAR